MFVLDTFYAFYIILVLISLSSMVKSTSSDSSSTNEFDRPLESHYVVSIRTRQPLKYFGDNHYCGGVIIDKRHILTAALCVTKSDMVIRLPRELLIIVGSHKRFSPVAPRTTQQIGVSKIHIKREYQITNTYNIAVLTLKRDIIFSEYAKQIEIDEGAVPYGSQCTILGWGRLYPAGPLPNKCMETQIDILPMDKCRNISKEAKEFGDNMICAGDLTHSFGQTCDGDSGGPLICAGKLIGIATWTVGCRRKDYPSFFESVSFHKKFIRDSMEDGSISIHALQTITLPIACVVFVLKYFDSL